MKTRLTLFAAGIGSLLLMACAVHVTPKPPVMPRPIGIYLTQPQAAGLEVTLEGGSVSAPLVAVADASGRAGFPAVPGGQIVINLHVKGPAIQEYGCVVSLAPEDRELFIGLTSPRVGMARPTGESTACAESLAFLTPPVGDKDAFIKNYQANFGTIKVYGCGLHNDMLFDPYLLIAWATNRPCYEQMMGEHAARGDNVVAVDPRSGYHGFGDLDLWHQPEQFGAFLRDVRQHVNVRGEHFKTQVFWSADGHIANFLLFTNGRADVNRPDPDAYAHWLADIDAMAAATEDAVDATVVCWECRHQQDFIAAVTYVAMAKHLVEKFPRAVHAHHLIAESSAWSSRAEDNDPNRGLETETWENCRREGYCDLFLYQFAVGQAYLYPDTMPNYTGFGGALGRLWEIAVRIGDDPWSFATSGGDRHGWDVTVPVIDFEFIYDTYWSTDTKATEAYAVEFCKRALAIGGWGCGSASYRRPQ